MMTRNAAQAAIGITGVILAAAGFWAGKSLTTATVAPTVQTGTVTLVNADGDEFAIRLGGQSQQTGYALPANVSWRNAYGAWNQGRQPQCMRPLSHGQRITIGVISTMPVAGAPGGQVVVWIECAARPVPRYPIVSPAAIPARHRSAHGTT